MSYLRKKIRSLDILELILISSIIDDHFTDSINLETQTKIIEAIR